MKLSVIVVYTSFSRSRGIQINSASVHNTKNRVSSTKYKKAFLTIKPTRCTNFSNLFSNETRCFRQFLCPSSGVIHCTLKQWYMSYRFVDSCSAGSGCSKAVYKTL
jgi:hypothetical protein